MGIIKGQNLRLFIDGKCVAAATNASIHTNATTEDVSTKDSTGDWAENEVTGFAWDASVEALVANAADSDANDVVKIYDAYKQKKEVSIKFIPTEGHQNRETTSSPYFEFTGKAYITDLSIQAQNKSNVTFSAQFTGNGELAMGQN